MIKDTENLMHQMHSRNFDLKFKQVELATCLRSQITAKLIWLISSRTPLEVRRIMQSRLSWHLAKQSIGVQI